MQAGVSFRPSSRFCSIVADPPGLTLLVPEPPAPPKLLVTQLFRMVTFFARTWMPPLTFHPSMMVLSAVTTTPPDTVRAKTCPAGKPVVDGPGHEQATRLDHTADV